MHKIATRLSALLATAAAMAAPLQAHSATVTVLPGDPTWVSSGNSGGGSSAITGTAPRSGNGSIEMTGDRTRFGAAPPTLGLLNDVLSLTYDWSIALGSTSLLNVDYTPALRLHVRDGSVFSELIWEGAYNGTYGNTTKGVWYTSEADDVFHRWVSGGPGTTLDNGSQVNLTIQQWADNASSGGMQWYSDAAEVIAISVGVGSSVGGGYRAFADNIVYTTAAGSTTFNFELRAANGVPEPGSLALAGLALLGAAALRRRR